MSRGFPNLSESFNQIAETENQRFGDAGGIASCQTKGFSG